MRSPEDGHGTARVEPPDPVRAGTPGTWKITFEVGGPGIATGGGVNLVVSAYWGWSRPQIQSPRHRGYTTLHAEPRGATLGLETAGQQVFVRVEDGRLEPGEQVVLTYGDTSQGEYPDAQALCDRFAESREEFHLRVDGDGDGFYASLPYEEQPSIEILGREPVRLSLVGPSLAAVGHPVAYALSILDALDNRASGVVGVARIEAPEGVTGVPEGLVFGEGADQGSARSFEASFEEPGVYTLRASFPESGRLAAESNPILVTEEEPALQIYWADLQGHGGLCDGSGTPEDYYAYGRDVSRLDVCALTTHDAWGLYMMDEHPIVYELGRSATEAFHEPGRFVTILGYEYTNWTSGHKHVLFPGDQGPVVSYRMEEGENPDRLWKALEGTEAITVSHHPGGGPIGQDWSYFDPDREPVVEMCSIHGSSEYFGCPQMVHRPEKGGFAQDALARGHRMGFIGSGDTHNGHPGRGDRQSPTGGLAAIFAKELTRESIFEALRSRRVYATSGPRIIVTLSVEAIGEEREESGVAWMGGEVELSGPQVERAVRGTVIGESEIESIELVKNNETVVSKPGRGSHATLEIGDGEPARSGDFYYLRVTQVDGGQAWSSPVWLRVGGSGP